MVKSNFKIEESECILPCDNLLEFIEYFLSAYNTRNIQILDFLIDSDFSEYKNQFEKYKTTDMFYFVIYMIFRNDYNRQYHQEQWLNFDNKKLLELLEDPFFDEYIDTVVKGDIDRNKKIEYVVEFRYIWIEFYTFFKVLSFAASILSYKRTHLLWYYLCYEDIIDRIYGQEYYSIISNIYNRYGWEWFCINRYGVSPGFDLIMYKWGFYSILAEKKIGTKSSENLKMDFIDLYTNFSSKCAQAEAHFLKDELIQYFKYELNHFDDDRFEMAAKELERKDHVILNLQNDLESLKRSYQSTIENIKLIQTQKGITESDKVNRILKHLYACLPDKLKGTQLEKRFEEIWENLSDQSRIDITQAVKLFEIMKNTEFSSLALLRSLERELELNIFKPFRECAEYNAVLKHECQDVKLVKTHELLTSPVTLGVIPILGGALQKDKNIKNSTILKSFNQFLGDKKEVFYEICSAIGKYKIGEQSLSIIKIRNGIVHGDTSVTECCDEECYQSIFRFIYEPPIQIMFSIILHSLKKIKE